MTRPIFVMGSPRSGTTMLGELIGSSEDILHVGELSAFYFSSYIAEKEYKRVPSEFKDTFLESLKEHSKQQIAKICAQNKKEFFVEDTPWNYRIISTLEQLYPDSVYVLSYRNAEDVVLSMRESYQAGYKWAGPEDTDRFALWRDCYSCIHELPLDRTVIFNYDNFKAHPDQELEKLKKKLGALHIPNDMDTQVLKTKYAQSHLSSDNRLDKTSTGSSAFKQALSQDRPLIPTELRKAIYALRKVMEKSNQLSEEVKPWLSQL